MLEEDLQGLTAYSPGVYINAKYRGRQKFSTYIHEWLHMEFPKWKHENIYSAEEILADLLWKRGKKITLTDIRNAVKIWCKHWARRSREHLDYCLWDYLRAAGYAR